MSNYLHWHLSVYFFLQPQVIVFISDSVTIHSLSINTESTEFQPNFTGSKLVSGADIWFEQIKTLNTLLEVWKLRNSSTLNIFRNNIFRFITPSASSLFNSHNLVIKFTTRLRLLLSHLWKHKFKLSFQELLNPVSNCGLDIQLSSRYLLHYPTYNTERHTLLSTLKNIDNKLLDLTNQIWLKL